MVKLTPRQKAMQAAINSQNAYQSRLAEQERLSRQEPIKAIATSYDIDLGEWQATTPDGGSIAVASLSNANLKGRPLPVQRFAGSQESAINQRPTDADLTVVYDQLESVSQILLSRMAVQIGTGDPNNETVAGIKDVIFRYANDTFYSTDTGTLFYWDADASPAPTWAPIYQIHQSFTGTPTATVYKDGAIAINDTGTIYTGTVSGGWTELSGGGGRGDLSRIIPNFSAFSNPASGGHLLTYFPPAGSAIGDPIGIYDSGNTDRLLFPSAGAYEIVYRFTVNYPDIPDYDNFGRWQVSIFGYNSSGGALTTNGLSFRRYGRNEPGGSAASNINAEREEIIATFGFNTSFTPGLAYCQTFISYSVDGVIAELRPSTADMFSAEVTVKKLN